MPQHLDHIFESFPDVHELYGELLRQGYTADQGITWRRSKRESSENVTISFMKDGEVIRISQELNLATKRFSELFVETRANNT